MDLNILILHMKWVQNYFYLKPHWELIDNDGGFDLSAEDILSRIIGGVESQDNILIGIEGRDNRDGSFQGILGSGGQRASTHNSVAGVGLVSKIIVNNQTTPKDLKPGSQGVGVSGWKIQLKLSKTVK